MSDDDVQNYGNHRRWNVPWHFVVVPILLVNTVMALVTLARAPSWTTAWLALASVALLGALALLRGMALTVQNRVIRLEEHLRLGRLLPGRHEDIENLRLGQLIALRFASDREVEHLVDQIGRGELRSNDEIKRAVQHWRPDHLRA
jgi:hypothetical protein